MIDKPTFFRRREGMIDNPALPPYNKWRHYREMPRAMALTVMVAICTVNTQ